MYSTEEAYSCTQLMTATPQPGFSLDSQSTCAQQDGWMPGRAYRCTVQLPVSLTNGYAYSSSAAKAQQQASAAGCDCWVRQISAAGQACLRMPT